MKKTVLAVADTFNRKGFDVQSDIRTIETYGFEAAAVVTNSGSTMFTLDDLFSNAMKSRPEVCKIGLLTTVEACEAVANVLQNHPNMMVVYNPSIISDSGELCITEEVYNCIYSSILPMATLLTINSFEAELLAGFEIHGDVDALNAAKTIAFDFKCAVYVKSKEGTNFYDFLANGNASLRVPNYKMNPGFVRDDYSFSAALACELYDATSLEVASKSAKKFITGNSEKTYAMLAEAQKAPAVEEKKVEAPAAPVPEKPVAVASEPAKPVETPKVLEKSVFSFNIPNNYEKASSILGINLSKYSTTSKPSTSSTTTDSSVVNKKSTEIPEVTIVGRNEITSTADGKLRTTSSQHTSVREQSMSAQSKEVEVVAVVDNFAPEPVIDEGLSKSLQELREKLNRLK